MAQITDMLRTPSIELSVFVSRHPERLADELVRGLVGGGLVGPGVIIRGRDAHRIRFESATGVLRGLPDRGELELAVQPDGRAQARMLLWCGGMKVRSMVVGFALGALLGSQTAMLVSGPVGLAAFVAVGPLVGLATWWAARARLTRQVKAFMANIDYVKPL